MPSKYRPLSGRAVDWLLFKNPSLEKVLKRLDLRLSTRARILGATLRGCPKKPGPKKPPKSKIVLR